MSLHSCVKLSAYPFVWNKAVDPSDNNVPGMAPVAQLDSSSAARIKLMLFAYFEQVSNALAMSINFLHTTIVRNNDFLSTLCDNAKKALEKCKKLKDSKVKKKIYEQYWIAKSPNLIFSSEEGWFGFGDGR